MAKSCTTYFYFTKDADAGFKMQINIVVDVWGFSRASTFFKKHALRLVAPGAQFSMSCYAERKHTLMQGMGLP